MDGRLKAKLKSHKAWLNGEPNGQRLVLQDATLDHGAFRGCFMASAILKNVSFREADLTEANFAHAEMDGVHFDGAELSRSAFRLARITGCSFVNSRAVDAEVNAKWIRESSFHGASLDRSSFIKAEISDCDFRNARLHDAAMRRVAFHTSTLSHADLQGADLTSARIFESELSGVNIDNAELRDAFIDGAAPRRIRGIPATTTGFRAEFYDDNSEKRVFEGNDFVDGFLRRI